MRYELWVKYEKFTEEIQQKNSFRRAKFGFYTRNTNNSFTRQELELNYVVAF